MLLIHNIIYRSRRIADHRRRTKSTKKPRREDRGDVVRHRAWYDEDDEQRHGHDIDRSAAVHLRQRGEDDAAHGDTHEIRRHARDTLGVGHGEGVFHARQRGGVRSRIQHHGSGGVAHHGQNERLVPERPALRVRLIQIGKVDLVRDIVRRRRAAPRPRPVQPDLRRRDAADGGGVGQMRPKAIVRLLRLRDEGRLVLLVLLMDGVSRVAVARTIGYW